MTAIWAHAVPVSRLFQEFACGFGSWMVRKSSHSSQKVAKGRFAQVVGSSPLKVRLPCIGAPFWPFVCATMSIRFHRYNFRECALHENKKE